MADEMVQQILSDAGVGGVAAEQDDEVSLSDGFSAIFQAAEKMQVDFTREALQEENLGNKQSAKVMRALANDVLPLLIDLVASTGSSFETTEAILFDEDEAVEAPEAGEPVEGPGEGAYVIPRVEAEVLYRMVRMCRSYLEHLVLSNVLKNKAEAKKQADSLITALKQLELSGAAEGFVLDENDKKNQDAYKTSFK